MNDFPVPTKPPAATSVSGGVEEVVAVTSKLALKQLTIGPGEAISRQFHCRKEEIYFILSGSGELELGRHGEVVHQLTNNDAVVIPPGVVHRLIAGSQGIKLVEASTPETNDVIRIEDRYQRPANSHIDVARYLELVFGSK